MVDDVRPTIVCVDDEASVLSAVRTQLRDHLGSAYDIETATSGPEALELVDELLEDGIVVPVVISDEIMPEMRGHRLLAMLHQSLPDARKILMTGQAGLEAVVAAVNDAEYAEVDAVDVCTPLQLDGGEPRVLAHGGSEVTVPLGTQWAELAAQALGD